MGGLPTLLRRVGECGQFIQSWVLELGQNKTTGRQAGSLRLSPCHQAEADFIQLPRSGVFDQTVRNLPVSKSQVPCPAASRQPLKERERAVTPCGFPPPPPGSVGKVLQSPVLAVGLDAA